MEQTAEGITSVGPILTIARARGIEMPIVEQVQMVLAGTMKPRDLGPQLATEDGVPMPESRPLSGGENVLKRFWNRLVGRHD